MMIQVTLSPAVGSINRTGLSPVAALVRQHDRDRFQTALFAPVANREPLFALYAFNYEIARVRESVSEPMLGRIRLQWWRDIIGTAFEGGAARPYPVVEAITAAIRERTLTRAHFAALIDAREQDLDDDPPATLAALEAYAEANSARLIYLALEVLGAGNPAAGEVACHVGIAYGLAGLLRALPFHARGGRSFIPRALAVDSGLRSTPALQQAVATIAQSASHHLDAARALRRGLPRAALPALLPAVIAQAALRRLERSGFDPFAGTAAHSDPLQSWRLACAALVRRF